MCDADDGSLVADERLLEALDREDLSLEQAVLGSGTGGATLGELGQLFPRVEAEAPAA